MSDTRKPDTRRAFTLARKLKRLAGLAILATVAGCCTVKHSPDSVSHSAAGGYREACGSEFPGLIGDDC